MTIRVQGPPPLHPCPVDTPLLGPFSSKELSHWINAVSYAGENRRAPASKRPSAASAPPALDRSPNGGVHRGPRGPLPTKQATEDSIPNPPQSLRPSIVCPSARPYRPLRLQSGASSSLRQHTWSWAGKRAASHGPNVEKGGTLTPPPLSLFHPEPSPQSFSSPPPPPLSALITVKNSQRKKEQVERTCIFVISDCLPFSRQIDFQVSCYWKLSGLDRPVWLGPPLPSPSPRFTARLWGGLLSLSTRKSFR